MDFSPKKAVDSLTDRVRASERFPRIRDVEKLMKEEEERQFVERVRLAPKGKKKQFRSFQEEHSGADYFSSHVLNSDPSCAKYMDYNEVVYPMMDGKWGADLQPSETLERLWVSGFLDQVNRDMNNAYKSQLAQHEADKIKGKPKKIKAQSDNSVKRKGLSDEDELKLKKFEASVMRKGPIGMKKIRGGIQAYQEANDEIINARKPKKPELPFFHSHGLDNIFDRERIENNAARVIQKHWRRMSAIFKLNYVVSCMFNAVKIQRHVRGMIARRWVARYHRSINELAVQWQCRVRKWYSNKYLRPKLANEVRVAIIIQKYLRRWMARRYCKIKLHHVAATRIQALWRGIVARVVSDKVWLNRVVVPIQKFVRRVIAKENFKREFVIASEAALLIQKKFRCFVANKRLGTSLNKRESDYRMLLMEVLAAEEEFAEGTFTKLRQKLKKRGAKETLTRAMQDLHNSFTDIHILEADYIEMLRQKDVLSPRAIQQGWLQEIEKSIIDMRHKLTKEKLDCALHKAWIVLSIQDVIDRKVNEAEYYAYKKMEISDAREEVFMHNIPLNCMILNSLSVQEMECSQNRQLSFAVKERNDQKRSIIAAEKRRWKLRFYTKNGKPDRRRRPGRPWDEEILESAKEKSTYSGGADIDLTALNDGNIDSSLTGAGGSKETVAKAVKQVALQNYLNEVAKYEQLMNPLQKIMENHIKGASNPGAGYGSLGSELHAAAENNMVVPPPTPPRQKRPLTADFKSIIDENAFRGTTYAVPDNAMALAIFQDSASAKSSPSRRFDDAASVSSLGDCNPGDGDLVNPKRSKFGPVRSSKLSAINAPKALLSKSASVGTRSTLSESYVDPGSLFVEEQTSQMEPNPARKRWNRRHAPDDAETAPRSLKKRNASAAEVVKPKRGSSIPWHLLDQLDGEKRKFEAEREYILETKKF